MRTGRVGRPTALAAIEVATGPDADPLCDNARPVCPAALCDEVWLVAAPDAARRGGGRMAWAHATHAPLAVAALDAGLHVLCEKPMAPSVAEAAALVDAVARARARDDGDGAAAWRRST